jgi:hypothetical protein
MKWVRDEGTENRVLRWSSTVLSFPLVSDITHKHKHVYIHTHTHTHTHTRAYVRTHSITHIIVCYVMLLMTCCKSYIRMSGTLWRQCLWVHTRTGYKWESCRIRIHDFVFVLQCLISLLYTYTRDIRPGTSLAGCWYIVGQVSDCL